MRHRGRSYRRLAEAKAQEEARQREAEAAERQKKETYALAQLDVVETEAQSLIDTGNFALAMSKYDTVLNLIRDSQSQNPKLLSAIQPLTQARKSASDLLDRKREGEAAAQKRLEEERALASIKANVKGGAWVKKQTGTSDLMRGLNIQVLRANATKAQFLALLNATLEGENNRLDAARTDATFWQRSVAEDPNNELIRLRSKSANALLKGREKLVQITEEMISNASRRRESDPVDLKTIFSVLSRESDKDEIAVWIGICQQQLVTTVHTDIDGKYNVELSGGHYYFYAVSDSNVFRIDWMIPVQVMDARGITVDLDNDNAEHIVNK